MDNNLEILATMRDEASPQVDNLRTKLRSLEEDSKGVGDQSGKTGEELTGMQGALIKNKSAISELASGVQQLGTTFLGLAIAMQNSNNQMIQQLGNQMAMIGGIATAIGGTVRFISAISQMSSALKALNIQQVIANALAGPAGWAKLGIGLAVAGGAAYGISKISSSGGTTVNNNVTQHIAGSVVTERQLVDSVQEGLLQKSQRNATTGIS